MQENSTAHDTHQHSMGNILSVCVVVLLLPQLPQCCAPRATIHIIQQTPGHIHLHWQQQEEK